jgi:hypothetical protein
MKDVMRFVRAGWLQSRGVAKSQPNRAILPSWTSKHGKLAIEERDDRRSLEEENG